MRPGPPLCPAGHLPLKGGDRQPQRRRTSCIAQNWRKPIELPISPLEGEMSGRTEGGAWARSFDTLCAAA
ncbi:lytic murein transglycosylase [Mesorhizobium sp. B2-3-12]|nr:lytic murein transglycosylase [Mesorhizobium sp. B2-3-12]